MAQAVPADSPLTYQDLARFTGDGRRYELIDGTLVVTPAPGLPHQVVVAGLYRVLYAARPDGVAVLPAPVDFVPHPTTVLQPDVVVFDATDADEPRLIRPPHLVVEVTSPSSRAQDLGAKLLAYAQAGVRCYWVVDPELPVEIAAFRLEGTEYGSATRARGDERFDAAEPFPVAFVPSALREV